MADPVASTEKPRGYVSPAIDRRAFNCPHRHCGAHARQFWYRVSGDSKLENELPDIVSDLPAKVEHIKKTVDEKFGNAKIHSQPGSKVKSKDGRSSLISKPRRLPVS